MDDLTASTHLVTIDSSSSLDERPPHGFSDITAEALDALSAADLDALPFGVIGLTSAGEAAIYNATESSYAGLARERVIGRPFFLAIGVCMNNFLVAQRLEDESELDVIIDYVLTFRMRPTPVKLRLLKTPTARHRFILLQR